MSLFSQLHLLPRPFWVLVGATFVNRFGVFVVPFLALVITRNGNTAAQAGLAVAAYSLGGFGAAWIASLAPEDMRGRCFGFLSFAWCAGNTAGSALGMPLDDHYPSVLWTLNAALVILAAALILYTRRIT